MRRAILVALFVVAAAVLVVTAARVWSWRDFRASTPPPSAGPLNAALNGGHPIFADVTGIVLHRQGTDGDVIRDVLEDRRLEEAVECLELTRELGEQFEEPPLEEVVLVEIADRYGDRMFQPYSAHLVAGNRRRHYWSPCLSSLAAR
jgi:hypothetical protein